MFKPCVDRDSPNGFLTFRHSPFFLYNPQQSASVLASWPVRSIELTQNPNEILEYAQERGNPTSHRFKSLTAAEYPQNPTKASPSLPGFFQDLSHRKAEAPSRCPPAIPPVASSWRLWPSHSASVERLVRPLRGPWRSNRGTWFSIACYC